MGILDKLFFIIAEEEFFTFNETDNAVVPVRKILTPCKL